MVMRFSLLFSSMGKMNTYEFARLTMFVCLSLELVLLTLVLSYCQMYFVAAADESYLFVRSWGGQGSNGGQFVLPHSLATDPIGNVYVTDTGNNRIEKFNSDGTLISAWGSEGTGDGQFSQLHDVNVDPKGDFVYTLELGNHRVQKFTSNGTFVTKWGFENTGGEGASRQPHQLALDSTGNVYLTDRANSEILVFDSNGKYLMRWGLEELMKVSS